MPFIYCAKGNPYDELPEMDQNPFFNDLGREVFVATAKNQPGDDKPKTNEQLEERVQQGKINPEKLKTLHAANKVKGNYWFSLTSSNQEVADASCESLQHTIQTAANLGIPTVVVHGDAVDLEPNCNERETIKKAHEELAQIFTELYNSDVKLALETQPRRVYDTVPNYGISANVTRSDFDEIQEFMGDIPLHLCIDEEHVYKAAIGEYLDAHHNNIIRDVVNSCRIEGEPPREYVYALDQMYRTSILSNVSRVEDEIEAFIYNLIGTSEEEKERIAVVHACGYQWEDHRVLQEQNGDHYFIPKSHNPPIPNETLYVGGLPTVDQINHGLVLRPLSESQTEIPVVIEMDRKNRIDLLNGEKKYVGYTTYDGREYSFGELVNMSIRGLNKALQV